MLEPSKMREVLHKPTGMGSRRGTLLTISAPLTTKSEHNMAHRAHCSRQSNAARRIYHAPRRANSQSSITPEASFTTALWVLLEA